MAKTAGNYRLKFGLDDGFGVVELQKKIGDNSKNREIWIMTVHDKFDHIWSEMSDQDRTTTDTVKSKDDDPEQDTRVCTTTMKEILRPELHGSMEKIIQINDRQDMDQCKRKLCFLRQRLRERTD